LKTNYLCLNHELFLNIWWLSEYSATSANILYTIIPYTQKIMKKQDNLEVSFRRAAGETRMGGKEVRRDRVPFGDVGVKIPFLPKVKISFIIWRGDDEFPPQGKILFNSHIASYLSTEGIVIASQMIFGKLKDLRS